MTRDVTRPRPSTGEAPSPLPDPRLDPLVPPEAERHVPPRLAAMKAMGSGVGTLGLEVGLSVVVGLLGGQYLDDRLGTSPWLTILGFGFGLAAAVRSVLRQMRRMRVEAEREEKQEGNPAPLWESQGERDLREARAAREERLAVQEPDATSSKPRPHREDQP